MVFLIVNIDNSLISDNSIFKYFIRGIIRTVIRMTIIPFFLKNIHNKYNANKLNNLSNL